ncbi:acyl-CoA dehydrogenase family protein [Natrinema soli]|uniref:Acyl-CoA dehydrogenase family protein n=1 Tax=Natrinema soli TaxID=1930624 RepID=A0ABD5SGW9_9EURY|nr:acyl-CoA dehydrogenase family protein [Natrinema soli]
MSDSAMSFETPEQVQLINSQIDEFLKQEVKPLEEEYPQFLGEDGERNMVDDDHHLVDEYLELRERIHEKSVEAGFYTMAMPERVGGGGLSALEDTLVMEHLHNRDPNGYHDMIFDRLSVDHSIIPLYDDEYQREEYFEPVMNAEKHMTFGLTEPEHGSDPTWMDSTAEKDGDEWVINGTKAFISNSVEADFIMVHARTSGEDGDADGISTFLVDKDNPGWEDGKVQRSMGTKQGAQAFNHFNDCRVPEAQMVGDEGEGFRTAMTWVGAGRLHIPAKAVGISQWMFEKCVEYAEDRKTFGEPIGSRQHIQDLLVEMRVTIEQVRWLYRHAAWKMDQGEEYRWLQSAAKLQGANLWCDAADNAIQIHGGAGYMKSLPFEGLYRDGRVTRIYEGSDEIQKRTIARQFLNL